MKRLKDKYARNLGQKNAATMSEIAKGDMLMSYKKMDFYVVAIGNNKIFAQNPNNKMLYVSTDFGETWVYVSTLPKIVRVGTYTDAGKLVLIVENALGDETGTVKYSIDDGLSFTDVLSNIYPPLINGIDRNGEVICFCEYITNGASVTINIYKSANGGATWVSKSSQSTPTIIRHYHTMKYFSDYGKWVCTSGDAANETIWWVSSDNGDTWSVLVSGGDANLRCVGLASLVDNTIIFGADNASTTHMYAANVSDPAYTYLPMGFVLSGHCMGVAGDKTGFMAVTRKESADSLGSYLSTIYTSLDGVKWNKEYHVTEKALGNGASGILGPDKYGNFYAQFSLIEEYADSLVTIRAKPNNDKALPIEPIKPSYSRKQYTQKTHNAISVRSTSTQYGTASKYNVENYFIQVVSTLDQALSLRISDGANPQYQKDGTTIMGNGISIPAGNVSEKRVIIQASDLGLPMFPKGWSVGLYTGTIPTTGTLTATIIGQITIPDDVRLLSAISSI